MNEVHITVGLPGAGKTTYCTKMEQLTDCTVIHVDDLTKSPFTHEVYPWEHSLELIVYRWYTASFPIFYLDGLFLSTEAVIEIVEKLTEAKSIDTLVIEFWQEDKNACLLNDEGRHNRPLSSANTILFSDICFDIRQLRAAFPKMTITMNEHQTILAPEYIRKANHSGIELVDGKYLDSYPWCIGGVQRGYQNECEISFPVDTQDQPISFTELEDYLLQQYPDCTLKQFITIMRTCVSIEEKQECDYYSRVTLRFFRCDMEKAHHTLTDKQA